MQVNGTVMQPADDRFLARLHAITCELAIWAEKDLSAREFAVFLVCYLEHGPNSVCDLTARLEAPRAAMLQALDRLESLDLIRRREDADDERNVMILQTAAGRAFLGELAAIAKLAWAD